MAAAQKSRDRHGSSLNLLFDLIAYFPENGHFT